MNGAGLDCLNPVLVRRYQQLLRGRSFVWTYQLMLALQLVVALVFVLNSDAQRDALFHAGVGSKHFGWVIGQLAFVVVLVVPVAGCRGLAHECRMETLQLLMLTPLSPRRIAWGFLGVQAAEIGVLVALTLPFLVCSYLFRGVDVMLVAVALHLTVMGAFCTNAVMLMVGSFARFPGVEKAVRGLFAVLLVVFFAATVAGFTVSLLGWTIGCSLTAAAVVFSSMTFFEINVTNPRLIPTPIPYDGWEDE